MNSKFPIITIILATSILVVFWLMSSLNFFSTESNFLIWGFSLQNIQNVFSYNFVHTGFPHLMVNLIGIITGGVILESLVRKRTILGLFFIGSGVSAILISLINPNFSIVGASAGAAALLAAAALVEPKKTIALFLGFIIFLFVLIPLVNSFIDSQTQTIETEIKALEIEKLVAQEHGNQELVKKTQETIESKLVEKQEIEKGIELSASTIINLEIHLVSALFASLYMLFFEKKLFRRKTSLFGYVHNFLNK